MKILISFLIIFGVLFSVLTIVATFGVVSAYIERTQHGAGLMFADVEILAGLAIIFLLISIICFWSASKFKKAATQKINILLHFIFVPVAELIFHFPFASCF